MRKSLPKRKIRLRGQILLSILISIGIFAILAHALFTLIASSFDLVNFNRSRITARHLAQERIELIRNMPYADIGTIGGIPNGTIEDEENIVRNGLNFIIKTTIIYIDDDFNGSGIGNNTDYKRVRVEVSWEGLAASKKNPVVLITDINSQGANGATSGGTLVVLVFDANGDPVPQAQVTIVASSIDPPVNSTYDTSDEGEVSLPGAIACDSCYEITVEKTDYSTDRTYSTSEVTNPIKPHASVIEGDITQVSFAIDLTGTINISSKDSRVNNFTDLGNVPFRLRGNKIIGTNAFGQYVYKFDQTLSTDGSGNYNLDDAEWDTYSIIMPALTSYDISGSNPVQPLSLLPSDTINVIFSVEPHTDHSFLAIVKDPSQNLVASASARLFNGGAYDQTLPTGATGSADFGQAFFSGLEEKTYNIEATASGYLNFSGSFDVSGYSTGEVVLTPE